MSKYAAEAVTWTFL